MIGELSQNEMERIDDKLKRGLITVDEANAEMILCRRVYLVFSRLPRSVRNAYNAAVKVGILGHVKKDGLKPEAYYHPKFEYLVPGMRNEEARRAIAAIAKVCI